MTPTTLAIMLGGLAASLVDESRVIEDRDPGDEQPEPDYTAIINAAIDRRMNPAPTPGAGHAP